MIPGRIATVVILLPLTGSGLSYMTQPNAIALASWSGRTLITGSLLQMNLAGCDSPHVYSTRGELLTVCGQATRISKQSIHMHCWS